MSGETNQEKLPISSAQVASIYSLVQARIFEIDERSFGAHDYSPDDIADFDPDWREIPSPITDDDRGMYMGFLTLALANPHVHGYCALITVADAEREISIENAREESQDTMHTIKAYAIVHSGFKLAMFRSTILATPRNLEGIKIDKGNPNSSIILQDEVGDLMARLV